MPPSGRLVALPHRGADIRYEEALVRFGIPFRRRVCLPTSCSSQGLREAGTSTGGGTLQPEHENDFSARVQRALAARERVPGHQGVTILPLRNALNVDCCFQRKLVALAPGGKLLIREPSHRVFFFSLCLVEASENLAHSCRSDRQRQVDESLMKEASFRLISFRFCQISLRRPAIGDESRNVIVHKRWEKMQRKYIRFVRVSLSQKS